MTKNNEEKLSNSIDKFEIEKKRSNFDQILSKISNIDSKKKSLWLEIYGNAVDDRERASMLFTEAYQSMGNSTADHVAIGAIMAKYLERMSKSNDQIMNLATLIDKSERAEENLDPEALFKKIQE